MADRAVGEMERFGSAREAAHSGGGLERAQGLHRWETVSHAVTECENHSHNIPKQIVCPEPLGPLDFGSRTRFRAGEEHANSARI
jgi:hypothetical protein